MKIHFTTKGSKSLKGIVVTPQAIFDDLQSEGLLEQRGLIFWYVASDGFAMRKIMTALQNRIHRSIK